MTLTDWTLLAMMAIFMTLTVIAASLGQTAAAYTPVLSVAPVSWGLVFYMLYLIIPTLLHIKEAIQWHISKSKI
jgi:uncharacterized protein (DUF486 family)